MCKSKFAIAAAIAVAVLSTPAGYADAPKDRGKIVSQGEDGSVCYELDVKEASQFLNNMEAMEKKGKIKEAFDVATGPSPGCMADDNADDRIFGVVERTYKKLGQQAEKAGQIYEAHKYYIYPYDIYYRQSEMYRERMKKYYSLADANRTMLVYAKANRDDYKVVDEAINYFKSVDDAGVPPQLKEVYGLAMRNGEKLLAKEDKDFTARKYKAAFDDLKESKRWFELADDDRDAQARAKQRGEALLAEDSYDAVERAFNYAFEYNSPKLETARFRASKLGDAAEQRGDLELAERFYGLAGDDAKHDAVVNKRNTMQEQKEKQKEQAEAKRQDKFKKDQKSLEDELGF
jgi:hypothetical protein